MKKPDFTKEQEYWLCDVIGYWYLLWKRKIAPGEHSLGFAKEQLKEMICYPDKYYNFNEIYPESKPQESESQEEGK